MGDWSGFMDKVQEVAPVDQQPDLLEKLSQGQCTLRTDTCQNILKMGPVGLIAEKEDISSDLKMEKSRGCSATLPGSQSTPWLMFSHGKSTNIQTFYSIPENRSVKVMFPDLSNSIINASYAGWVVITRRRDKEERKICGPRYKRRKIAINSYECFLLNLVSMEKVTLPTLEQVVEFEECILTSPPSQPNSCIVAFFSDDGLGTVVKFWRPGQEKWLERYIGRCLSRFMVSSNGKIYVLEDSNHIKVLNIVNDEFEVISEFNVDAVPLAMIPEARRYQKKTLIESCNKLFLVRQLWRDESFERIRAIEVFKLECKRR